MLLALGLRSLADGAGQTAVVALQRAAELGVGLAAVVKVDGVRFVSQSVCLSVCLSLSVCVGVSLYSPTRPVTRVPADAATMVLVLMVNQR